MRTQTNREHQQNTEQNVYSTCKHIIDGNFILFAEKNRRNERKISLNENLCDVADFYIMTTRD